MINIITVNTRYDVREQKKVQVVLKINKIYKY